MIAEVIASPMGITGCIMRRVGHAGTFWTSALIFALAKDLNPVSNNEFAGKNQQTGDL